MAVLRDSPVGLGSKRQRFAWWPVAAIAAPKPFTSHKGWYWLQPVVETSTISVGWIAYANDNPALRPLSHRTIVAASLGGLATAFAALASAIHPLVISLR
jgi:hypothetical protein